MYLQIKKIIITTKEREKKEFAERRMVKIRKTKGRRIRQKDSSRQAVGPMLSSIYETSFLNKTSHNSL